VGRVRFCQTRQTRLVSRQDPVYDHIRVALITSGTSGFASQAAPKYQNTIQNPYLPRPPQTPAAQLKRLYRK
jgi:hypothetical protein